MSLYTRTPDSNWQKIDLGMLKVVGLSEKKLMEKLIGKVNPGDEIHIVAKVLEDGSLVGFETINGEKVLEFVVRR